MMARFRGGRGFSKSSGSHVYWNMVVLPVSVRDCRHCCALFPRLLTRWLGFSGTSLAFRSPPIGRCQSRFPDGPFKEWNITSLGEFSLVEDFLSLSLHRHVYDLLISERGKHVLASSQASSWISATTFGCKINASFDNVCILWFFETLPSVCFLFILFVWFSICCEKWQTCRSQPRKIEFTILSAFSRLLTCF